MALRVQLINDTIGSAILETADPVDINEVVQTVKRSKESDGIIYEVIMDLEFIQDGRTFIKNAYDLGGGIDSEVFINIYELDPNLRKWNLYSSGQINWNKYDLYEDRAVVQVEQIGFQRRVLNMKEIDVDMETLVSENGSALPSNNIIDDLTLHSKKILEGYDATSQNSAEVSQLGVIIHNLGTCGIGPCNKTRDETVYGQFDNSSVTIDDLQDTFKYPAGWNPDEYFEFYRAKTVGVADINIQLRFKMSVIASQAGAGTDVDITAPCSSSGILANVEVKLWFEHRDVNNNVKTLTQFGTYADITECAGTGVGDYETHSYSDSDVDIEIGDKLYVYQTVRINGTYEESGGTITDIFIQHELRMTQDQSNCWFRINTETEFPESTSKALLSYEAVERCIQFYTNQIVCFKSNLLGRTDLGYASDGLASLIAFTNGASIAKRDKPIILNFQKILDFLNANFCVGFGFEVDEDTGAPILRLEQKSYFYDKSTRILSLGKVYNIKRSIISESFYNQIEFGYSNKIDLKQSNGVDEFNTLRRFIIPIVNTKNKLQIATDVHASGWEIETQRRLSISTEDSKLDDEVFAIQTLRDVGDTFVSEAGSGWTITGVYDAATGYNYRISPRRSLKNWKQFIASGLIRSNNKVCKFTFGEGNFTMTSLLFGESVLAENGDLDLTGIEPIWDNETYDFEAPLSRSEMELIKATPFGYIEFKDQFDEVMQGFIDVSEGIKHNASKGTATFKLLKVHRP